MDHEGRLPLPEEQIRVGRNAGGGSAFAGRVKTPAEQVHDREAHVVRRPRPRQEDAGRGLVGVEAGRLQEPLEGRRTVPNQTGRLPPHLGLLRNFAGGVNRSPIRIGMIDHVLKHIAVRISSF